MRKISFSLILVLIIIAIGYYSLVHYKKLLVSQQSNQTLLTKNAQLQTKIKALQTQLKKQQSQLTSSQQKLDAALKAQQENQHSNLTKAFINDYGVQAWANMAAVRAYSFDFMNYKNSFIEIKKYFTSAAWPLFQKALMSSGTLTTAINKKMVVSAVATGAVEVTDLGIKNGVYTWQAILPLKVNLANSTDQINTDLNVTLTIVRTNQDGNIQGLAINNFEATLSPKTKAKVAITNKN